MNLESGSMDIDDVTTQPPRQSGMDRHPEGDSHTNSYPTEQSGAPVREMYRELHVRVHVRKPGRDSWLYVGRATVSHEVVKQTSRVGELGLPGEAVPMSFPITVVRTTADKVLVTFGEHCDVQAERRGRFVVVACVEPEGVLSWSFNAVNVADTLRLLASIELACYRSKQLYSDPMRYASTRRKIERVIRDDRRKRHRRKKDEEVMITAFAQQKLG